MACLVNQTSDFEVEKIGAQPVDLVLEPVVKVCKVCKVGNLTAVSNNRGCDGLIVYTRDGTYLANHVERICNNRQLPCRAGHFYGYVSLSVKASSKKFKCYDKEALKNEYLVTSNQTAFSTMYLWDCVTQIVFSNASFESLAKVYNTVHFVNLPTDVMQRRIEINRKRIAEGVFTFFFLEVGQRYEVPPIIFDNIDETILRSKVTFRDQFRKIWSVDHKCEIQGCDSVLVIDGGMKPTRQLCAAKLHGMKEFEMSGMVVVCGCLKAPMPNSKYCSDHVNMATPAMTSNQVSSSTRMTLRDHRKATSIFKESPQDNIYVIESLVDKKIEENNTYWKVQWLGFPPEQATWEVESNIQKWITSYYDAKLERLGSPLPEPRVKHSKRAGDEIYHYLSWDGVSDEPSQWVGDSFFKIAADDGELVSQFENDNSCNTHKTKDKRDRR